MRTRHSTKDIERAATLFFRVRARIRTTLSAGKKLDPSKWLRIETLKFIADHGEPSMRSVADYLSITAPSATSLAAGLARDGLIKRKADPRDRRTVRLALTPRGERELAQAVARGMKLVGGVFAPLSPRELAAFIRALEHIERDAR